MPSRPLPTAIAVLLAGCAHAPPVQDAAAPVLPLKSVRLYETGIGYFERAGLLDADASLSLPVPASHLDDALKTLVVLSDGGRAKVHGLEFGSRVTPGSARALAGLPADADVALDLAQLLKSLKGATVEVTLASRRETGRIVEVVTEAAPEASAESGEEGEKRPPPSKETTFVLLTDRSEIRSLRASQVQAVRPLDPALATRLNSALDALSPRTQGRRLMRLSADVSGPVTLGYVAETPVWRTTWRLVLDEKGQAMLQGWALIHNDTDEDWKKVRVELVNGRPDSFLYPLAAPRYSRRSLAHPEEALSTVPQLLDQTPDGIWGEAIGDAEGAGGLGLHGTGGGGAGYGSGIGTISSKGSIRVDSLEDASALLSVGNLAATEEATGAESGELFVYTLASPLDLRAHGSALVPFLMQPVEAERVSIFDKLDAPGRAGVRLTNGTRQTLPAGTLAAFAAGGLAGEAGLVRLKPGQRQLIRYGADPDSEVTEQKGSSKQSEEVRRVLFLAPKSALEEHFIRRTTSRWVLENRGGRPRTLYVKLAIASNAKATGADEIAFDAETSTAYAIFRLKPGERVARAMDFEEGLSRATRVGGLRPADLERLAAAPALPDAERGLLKDAMAHSRMLEEAERRADKAREEVARIEKDIERLEKHLSALGGEKSGDGKHPFVQRLLAAEDRLTAAKKAAEGAAEGIVSRKDKIREALAKLPPAVASQAAGETASVAPDGAGAEGPSGSLSDAGDVGVVDE